MLLEPHLLESKGCLLLKGLRHFQGIIEALSQSEALWALAMIEQRPRDEAITEQEHVITTRRRLIAHPMYLSESLMKPSSPSAASCRSISQEIVATDEIAQNPPSVGSIDIALFLHAGVQVPQDPMLRPAYFTA